MIDGETGEEIDRLEYGDRIVRKASIDAKRRKEEREKEAHEFDRINSDSFIKIFDSALDILIENPLSALEQRVMFTIMKHTTYETNVARCRNGKPLVFGQLMKILKVPERSLYRALKVLCDRGLISIYEVGETVGYILNPNITMKGKWIDKTTSVIFSEHGGKDIASKKEE